LESVILDAAEVAAERTFTAWRQDPAGAGLLDDLGLARSSPELRAAVGGQVRGWQSDVLDLVREQGAAKRGMARALSFGVNALGISLMIVVFASTGGLTGAEIVISGGTAVVGQKLLEAVFGDDAVRKLAGQAKTLLEARAAVLLNGQAARYTTRLAELDIADDGGAALRAAGTSAADVAQAQRAARDQAARGRADAKRVNGAR
jgi:hypothetical protein